MDILKKNKIIAVVRNDDLKTTGDFATACIDGGIRLLEVIITGSGSYELIEELSGVEGIAIGAGTVLNTDMAKNARDAGAKFIVSPHTDVEIIGYTKSNGLISIPGAFTSSEIMNAYNMGADYVKIFPASSVGPGYVKAIKEAMPFIKILVTGGININNAGDFISAGASLLGIATALNGGATSFDKERVKKNSEKFINLIDKSG